MAASRISSSVALIGGLPSSNTTLAEPTSSPAAVQPRRSAQDDDADDFTAQETLNPQNPNRRIDITRSTDDDLSS